MDKIILIGGGGHCQVIVDTLLQSKEYKIFGIVDVKEKVGQKVLGIPIIGVDKDLGIYFRKGIRHCFISLGSVGNPTLRVKLFNLTKGIGFRFPNIVHPSALISKFVRLGSGNYIAAAVKINAAAQIANNCIINTGTIIEHDCRIGDFVHLAPGVFLSAAVTIGRNSHIGIGSSVIQSIKIGHHTIIGAGSVVVENMGDNIVAFGNPCRKAKSNAR
jgi:sugar O-acyltransferase (sialic acid O-acetyltransferase NeuD family)